MDGRNNGKASLVRGTYDPPPMQRWIGIYNVKEGGVWEKKLCLIYGQHSTVVAVGLDQGSKAPFTKLVITCAETGDSVAASIEAAAGLTSVSLNGAGAEIAAAGRGWLTSVERGRDDLGARPGLQADLIRPRHAR